MTSELASFADYVASLTQLSNPFDPTVPTAQSEEIRVVARQLAGLSTVDRATLAALIADNPDAVPVLGLAVGLTREKLKNVLRHHLGRAAWTALARERAADVIAMLDDRYDAVRLIEEQRHRAYDFGDVLVARGRRPPAGALLSRRDPSAAVSPGAPGGCGPRSGRRGTGSGRTRPACRPGRG
jgi:hypothetical protein